MDSTKLLIEPLNRAKLLISAANRYLVSAHTKTSRFSFQSPRACYPPRTTAKFGQNKRTSGDYWGLPHYPVYGKTVFFYGQKGSCICAQNTDPCSVGAGKSPKSPESPGIGQELSGYTDHYTNRATP